MTENFKIKFDDATIKRVQDLSYALPFESRDKGGIRADWRKIFATVIEPAANAELDQNIYFRTVAKNLAETIEATTKRMITMLEDLLPKTATLEVPKAANILAFDSGKWYRSKGSGTAYVVERCFQTGPGGSVTGHLKVRYNSSPCEAQIGLDGRGPTAWGDIYHLIPGALDENVVRLEAELASIKQDRDVWKQHAKSREDELLKRAAPHAKGVNDLQEFRERFVKCANGMLARGSQSQDDISRERRVVTRTLAVALGCTLNEQVTIPATVVWPEPKA
jgi:hypothetical protein